MFFFIFLTGKNFTRNELVMFSVSKVGKNPYIVGKTKDLLRVDTSEANTSYVLAHCWGAGGTPTWKIPRK